MKPGRLNKIIHERVRLAMMAALAARDRLTFSELKEMLDVSDGNLSVHAGILEKHGLISVRKEFVGRKPRTTFILTARGRKELTAYIEEIESLLRPGK